MTDDEWHDGLCREFGQQVLTYLLAAPAVERQTAEDLTQDTLFQAWRDRDVVAGHPSPGGWLIVTARYKLANHRASHAVSRTGPLGDRDVLRPDDGAADLDLLLDVYDALLSLPERQREVMVLRYLIGYSVRETAQLLDIAEGTVTSVAADARAVLRTALADYHWDGERTRDG